MAGLLRNLHIHPLFWVVGALAVLTGYFQELTVLFVIVVIHEMGHAAAALYFSWRIKRITILPFGGVAEMEEHGNKPLKEELIVIAAGPVQHIWMAGAVWLLAGNGAVSQEWLQMALSFNAMILTFNLLPIWPLDGGKLIYVALSATRPFLSAYRQTMVCSVCFLAVLYAALLAAAPLQLNIWAIAIYLTYSLWTEWKQIPYVFMRFLLDRYYGKESSFRKLVPLHIPPEEFIQRTLERFRRGCKHPIHISGSRDFSGGKLDENEILHAFFSQKQIRAKVKDLMYID